MKIQNNTEITQNTVQTADKTPKSASGSYIFQAEVNITDGSIKLVSDRKNWNDAKKVYFINKDGSARKVSAWCAKDYPKGTFSKLYSDIKNYCNEIQSTILSNDEIKAIIDEFESEIDE